MDNARLIKDTDVETDKYEALYNASKIKNKVTEILTKEDIGLLVSDDRYQPSKFVIGKAEAKKITGLKADGITKRP